MSAQTTPQRQLILASPKPLSTSSLPSSRKRRRTPDTEARSAKKIAFVDAPHAPLSSLILTNFRSPFSWQQMNPLAFVEQRMNLVPAPAVLPNPLYQGPSDRLSILTNSRHIILPFDLRRNPGDVYQHMDIVQSIFPGTETVASDGFFITIVMQTLPSKPWPLTIGGVPLHLMLPQGPIPEFPTPKGRPPPRSSEHPWGVIISHDQDHRDKQNWMPLFQLIESYFRTEKIVITEVIYCQRFLTIVLQERNIDLKRLPTRAAHLACFYFYEDEMKRPAQLQARRSHIPTHGHPDEGEYQELQPGLRVTSGRFDNPQHGGPPRIHLGTTSGVMVRHKDDPRKSRYITVAAHGFPGNAGSEVFHPDPSGRKIGEIYMKIPHTDVAIVRLHEQETYNNVTFDTDTPVTTAMPLKGLRRADTLRPGDFLCLDSPDTGLIDATVQFTSMLRIPADDDSAVTQRWLFTAWTWMGENDVELTVPDGICGSAMWNEEGEVFSFFRYLQTDGPMKNYACSVGAEEIMDYGWMLY